jgi:aspartyl-tRNA(Asn)/glutamyl-tRNA(Gln) amidotransferase subunit C
VAISRAEVEKIALLARLRLTDDELDRMTGQLGDILEYVTLLSELDTEAVEPMAHASEIANVLRDDVVRPSLPREAALANAPRHDGECYLVPAVLGE